MDIREALENIVGVKTEELKTMNTEDRAVLSKHLISLSVIANILVNSRQ